MILTKARGAYNTYMARQSRIDYPGALNHLMIRGIERKNIFATDPDKEDFLRRLEQHVEKDHTICFAFAIMSNHAHLLLQTASQPVSRIMQSIQTGYAVSYNLRHNRTGKLYQNRFKSVLCDKEEYLLQLVRYIHLNPLKAGITETMAALDKDRWTSHSVYMGKRKREWVETEEVLSHFGRTEQDARKEYRSFIKSGIDQEEPIDFEGGGLIRSLGGYWETLKQTKGKKRKKEAADERILGSGKFVEEILKQAEEQEQRESQLRREGWNYERVKTRAAEVFGLSPESLDYKGRDNGASRGRALLCLWLSRDLKMSNREIAENLGVSNPAVSQMKKRGVEIEKEEGVDLGLER